MISYIFRKLISLSSFTLFAILFLIVFFVDCKFFEFGICEKLKLVPGTIYYPRFQIYRFFSFFLINSSFCLFLFDVIGFISFEALLDKRWNLAEKVKYLLITTCVPGLFCLIYYYVKFANTKTEADINFVSISGSSSFVAAVTVVGKQLMGEIKLNRFYFIQKYCTLIYLMIILFLTLFGLIESITFAYSCFGFLSGWIYLRFLQKHTDGKRGDHRSSFSFVRFFPSALQAVISLPCNCIYASVVACRLCPKIENQHEIVSASSFSKHIPNVSFDRHKRIALQDLNARLAEKNTESTAGWPSLFDEEPRVSTGINSTPEATALTVTTNEKEAGE